MPCAAYNPPVSLVCPVTTLAGSCVSALLYALSPACPALQAQGHESATQPPLDNFVPYSESPGFVGSEELPRRQLSSLDQQQQQDVQYFDLPEVQQQPHAQFVPLQDQPEQQQALGVQVVQQQQLVGPSIGEPAEPGAAGEGDEDDDELLGYDDPPGLFDYEAGKPRRKG